MRTFYVGRESDDRIHDDHDDDHDDEDDDASEYHYSEFDSEVEVDEPCKARAGEPSMTAASGSHPSTDDSSNASSTDVEMTDDDLSMDETL
jgi:hypothetical protein